MRDPARIDRIIEKLRQRWKENPDWRLGQLVVNVAQRDTRGRGDTFYFEDTLFEKVLDNWPWPSGIERTIETATAEVEQWSKDKLESLNAIYRARMKPYEQDE